MNITQVPSPNFSQGRGTQKVGKIIIHWMDCTLAQADQRFQTDGSRPPYNGVSAHFGVEDDEVHQYVPITSTAWHANNFLVNQQSVGIECSADPFRLASDATYQSLAILIVQICKQLGLTPSRGLLHKHNEYSNTACPGTMDLDRIAQMVIGSWVATPVVVPASIYVPAPVQVPIGFSVTVSVPVANFRVGPHLNSPIIRTYTRGTVIDCIASEHGDSVNGNDIWYRSSLHGYYISATVCNHN